MSESGERPDGLKRVLGLCDLSLLIVGSVIGSGIFLVPGAVLMTVGYSVPIALAVITGAIWSAGMAVTGTFNQLLTYVVFSGWIFYALGAAAVFRYRRTHPDLHRPYRVPWYPWPPLLFILFALALVGNTVVSKPKEAAVGLGLVLIGIPAYAFWNARNRPEAIGADLLNAEAD